MTTPNAHAAAPNAFMQRTLARSWIMRLIRRAMRRAQPWEVTLYRAALPEPVTTLIHTVVAGTRLRGDEQTDIARELVAHFTDALTAGESADAAARAYGDPRTSARLIRRATLRKRPMLYHARVLITRVVAVSLGTMVLGYAALAVRYFSGEPTISRHFAAEYNAAIDRIPESDRAAPLLSEINERLRPYQDLQRRIVTPNPVGPDEVDPVTQQQDLDAAILDLADALALARQAAARPRYGAYLMTDSKTPDPKTGLFPLVPVRPDSPPTSLIESLLPDLTSLHTVVTALDHEARLAAERGDAALAHDNIVAMTQLAELMSTEGFLINDVVGMAHAVRAAHRLGEILHQQPELFTDRQIQSLAHSLSAFNANEDHLTFDGEREMALDLAQRLFTDNGRGDGRLVQGWTKRYGDFIQRSGIGADDRLYAASADLAGPVVSVAISRTDFLRAFNERLNAIELWRAAPLWTRGPIPILPDDDLTFAERLTPDHLAQPLVQPLGHTDIRHQRSLQQIDGICAAAALELYRRDTGTYPDTLDPLTPRLLPKVPTDRWDGTPLKYRLTDAGPIIYSVGYDRIDNGGRPTKDTMTWWAPLETVTVKASDRTWPENERSGDMVLYPVPPPSQR